MILQCRFVFFFPSQTRLSRSHDPKFNITTTTKKIENFKNLINEQSENYKINIINEKKNSLTFKKKVFHIRLELLILSH